MKRWVGITSPQESGVLNPSASSSLQENDYIDSYFDNGEDFAAGSDDNMDGEATY